MDENAFVPVVVPWHHEAGLINGIISPPFLMGQMD